MRSFCSYIIFLFMVCTPVLLHAQTKKDDLQRQSDELNEKIALTKKLIREAESGQKLTSNQLAVLREQIRYREALIASISGEIRSIDQEIDSREKNIESLQAELNAMQKEYARMVVSAYQNRSSYDKLMYVFAADDFNQAYKRFKMTQHYAERRKEQMISMQKKQAELAAAVQTLQENKKQKQSLAASKEDEKKAIDDDKKKQEVKLSGLKAEEKKLREQQKKQESDRKKLTARIEEIIRAEIEAERKRTSSSSGTAAGASKLELAPEVKSLNADFEKNKGALPWPVQTGVVTSRFGRQPHPSIAGIEIDNKGIDFTTEKGGHAVAVFGGTVSSVFTIPGAGQNIIITHGSYKSVYSGLETVSVKVGDKVSNNQHIGTVIGNGEYGRLLLNPGPLRILNFGSGKDSAERSSSL
jgi:septal ring factor EnvC (AmiA/AmiB activator)